MGLFEEATSTAALRAGLEAALRNGGRAGPDGVSLTTFAAHAQQEIERLHEELRTGRWRPLPALQVKIPKSGGGYRTLAIGCVRDRVVQHAVAATLSAHFDDVLHPSAWGWRRGRSAAQCLAVVDAAMDAGKEWVLRGDVEDFFDRIPPQGILATLRDYVVEEPLLTLVGHTLAAGALAGVCLLDPMLGTAQGSPLSPFLANLYLLRFDRAVEAAGFEMMRYGDDLCIPTFTRDDARRALEVVTAALQRLRLRLNPNKVCIRHRGEGFTFLGWNFHRGGRRAGNKAHDALRQALDEAMAAPDHDEAVERVLRGWLNYYGSLTGVNLPETLLPLAERLEAERVQVAQLGLAVGRRSEACTKPHGGDDGAPSDGTEPSDDPWLRTAELLRAARGTPEEGAALSGFAKELRVSPTVAAELAEALRRYDGKAAAEVLARLGRYNEAEEVAALHPPATVRDETPSRSPGLPVTPEEVVEPPRFAPQAADYERLLTLFGGAEHTFFRDVRVGERIERQRVAVPPRVEHVKAHCEGEWWMGVYPLRANNSVRWGAFRIVQAGRTRVGSSRSGAVSPVAGEDARAVLKAFARLGITPAVSFEPGRAWVIWVFFAEAITAARARAFLLRVAHLAGVPDTAVTREIHPIQEVVKPDRPGTGMLLPLGRDPRTGERAWFCDATLAPLPDACGALRAIVPVPIAVLRRVMAGATNTLPLASGAPGRVAPEHTSPEHASPEHASPEHTSPEHTSPEHTSPENVSPGSEASEKPDQDATPGGGTVRKLPVLPSTEPVSAVAMETSPFRELPRAQDVYRGCAVFRHLVDQAITGRGMSMGDRMFVMDIAARLGDEAGPMAEAVLRHLDDYRPGMGARLLQRVYTYPASCARIRMRLPELTARVGCDCRFRVPPGAYPTPVLHALGAADVPGLAERVREVASRGGLARAALEAMNKGRKELGARASALCARLADLRRQVRVLERTIAEVENELDEIVAEAGDTPLETPSGTLERVVEGDTRRFILRV